MDAKTSSLEEFIVAVLRGATKILGCGSTNLILINEETQEIRIRLGTMAASYPLLAKLEHLMGKSFQGLTIPVERAKDSLVYRTWLDHSIEETSSLPELVGSALPQPLVKQVGRVIGEHRFICVPALSGARNYGVLLFQKEGAHPFNRQQREVLLRYARRIGEILENDLMGQGQLIISQLSRCGPDVLIFDQQGQLTGQGPPGSLTLQRLLANDQAMEAISARARALLGAPDAAPLLEGGDALPPLPDVTAKLELVPIQIAGQACALYTARAKQEDAEYSLENHLLQLTLGAVAPTLFLDVDFRITSINSATEQLLGYVPDQLVGQPFSRLFPEPQKIMAILSHQLLDPTNPYCEEATIILHKDGSVFPAHVEVIFLADDRDQVVGFLIMVRKENPTGADASNRIVRQERLATMGEMAAQLAHEIRNPLVAIGATLESLQKEEGVIDEHRDILAAMSHEIERMDMSLKDYLAARHDMCFTKVAVAALMDEARQLLEVAHRLEGKSITSAIPPDLVIHADHDAMKHIFFNLLLNALEASPTDGVVTCRSTLGPHDISIWIEDQGPGLAAKAEQCFQPFFTTKKNGTGLGLAVCQKIASAHGGLISLKSAAGRGCQAVVVLPRRAWSPSEAPA